MIQDIRILPPVMVVVVVQSSAVPVASLNHDSSILRLEKKFLKNSFDGKLVALVVSVARLAW